MTLDFMTGATPANSPTVAIPLAEFARTSPGRLPGELGTTRAMQDRVVSRLNAIAIAHELQKTIALGKVIIDEYFAGSSRLFVQRERNHISFQMLAERGDLQPGHRTLWYAAQIVALLDSLPAELHAGLTPSHLRELVGVHDTAKRVELARQAIRDRQPKEALREAIQQAIPPPPPDAPARGRPRLPKWACRDGHLAAETDMLTREVPTERAVRQVGLECARRRLDEIDDAVRRMLAFRPSLAAVIEAVERDGREDDAPRPLLGGGPQAVGAATAPNRSLAAG